LAFAYKTGAMAPINNSFIKRICEQLILLWLWHHKGQILFPPLKSHFRIDSSSVSIIARTAEQRTAVHTARIIINLIAERGQRDRSADFPHASAHYRTAPKRSVFSRAFPALAFGFTTLPSLHCSD